MIIKEIFSKFKDNSRTNCTFLEFKEFSRTKVIFKDFSRSVRTLVQNNHPCIQLVFEYIAMLAQVCQILNFFMCLLFFGN